MTLIFERDFLRIVDRAYLLTGNESVLELADDSITMFRPDRQNESEAGKR